jgi:hypothetical protein
VIDICSRIVLSATGSPLAENDGEIDAIDEIVVVNVFGADLLQDQRLTAAANDQCCVGKASSVALAIRVGSPADDLS